MKPVVLKENKFFRKVYDFFSDRKLRYDIITSFLMLFIMENVLTLSFTYISNESVSTEFARNAMTQNSEKILIQTKKYLSDVQKIVMLCRSLVDMDDNESLYDSRTQECLLQSLKQYPHFDTISVGFKNGNYLCVERRKPKAKFVTQAEKELPSNIKYVIQMQDRTLNPITEIFNYYNEDGVLFGEEKNYNFSFDPRERPWFKAVDKAEGDFVWTKIYEFAGTSSLCITAASPVYTLDKEAGVTNLAGVVGVDLLLDELAVFMSAQKVSENSFAFIVTKEGDLVAYPSNTASGGDSFDRTEKTINSVPQKHIKAAFQTYIDNQKSEFDFDFDKKKYLTSFTEINDSNGLDWVVGIVVPKTDFLNKVDYLQKLEVLLILFIAMCAFLVTLFLSKRISSPIIAVAEETQRLKDFSETEPLAIRSNIAEINMMIEAISAMRASLQSFGKFVPKVLVRRLMQKGVEIKLGGKMHEVTMFFSDIQDFTAISEGMPPDKLAIHLSDYFNELSKIIVDINGTIDKYIGDSIMAFWNAPNSDKNHIFNACRAALLCQKKLGELNRQWELEKKPIFYTRIGLHSTEVIVGNMGSDEKINYTLMGDGVNLASRLEGTNKIYKTKILVSHDVYKAVEERFLFRPVDLVAVKGKTEGVKIYELVGQMSGDSRLLPSKEEVELSKEFSYGFKLYQERRWGEAIKCLENLKAKFPYDYLTKMYLERCLEFKENPPKKNWDGIFVLTQK